MATTKGGAIVKKQEEQQKMLEKQKKASTQMGLTIQKMMPQIAKALPSVLTPERFTRMVLTAFSSTPKLQECTQQSFLGAMMQAAQLGVEPNTPLGQAYLIPYYNSKAGVMECQFQLGYKGLIDLAYRSGEITDVSAHEVHENDTFEYELGLTPKLKHVPALSNRGPVTMYYAVWHTKNGGYGFEVMSREDIETHMRKFSKAAGSSFSPWSTNFDAMAKKTVLKQSLKYAPLKTEFVRGMAADGTIKTFTQETKDVLDAPDENTYEAEAEDVPQDEPPVDKETGEILPKQEGEGQLL